MKIKTITYKRTKNLGNYENEVLELTAEVEDWENPDDVIASLQERVASKLGLAESIKKLTEERDNQEHELHNVGDDDIPF